MHGQSPACHAKASKLGNIFVIQADDHEQMI